LFPTLALRAELSLLPKGAEMTLKDNVNEATSCIEPISSASPLLLAPDERRTPIVALSLAKRNALIACLNAEGLHKKDGAWHGPLKRVSDRERPTGATRARAPFHHHYGPPFERARVIAPQLFPADTL